MAIDLTLVAEHDILIERIAIRVNAKRGHRAFHTAVQYSTTADDVLLTSTSGWLTFATCSYDSTNIFGASVLFDGPSVNGVFIGSVGGNAGGVLPISFPYPGILFTHGIYMAPLDYPDLPSGATIQWYEWCTCPIGHDHAGSKYRNGSQEND